MSKQKLFFLFSVLIFFSCTLTITINIFTYKLTIIEPTLEGKYIYITFYSNYSVDPVTHVLNGNVAGRARILISGGSGTSYIASSYFSDNALWMNKGTYYWYAFADMNGNASSTLYRPDSGDKYTTIIIEHINDDVNYTMSNRITGIY